MQREYTPQAKIEQKLIKMLFPTLWRHYDCELSNFGFTPVEFRQNIRAITRWMLEFPDYVIVNESGSLFLTDYI